jgi:peptide/nickel transport system substrate-binding protein
MLHGRWLIFIISVILAVIFIFPACSSSSSPAQPAPATTAAAPAKSSSAPAPAAASSPKSGGILKIGVASEATCLGQPGVGNRSVDSFLSAPAIEQIQRILPNGSMDLWLAESAKADDKALTLTISLKKGIQFQDGTPLDADALKWNIEWAMANKSTNVSKVKTVDIVDPSTVRLNLKEWGSDIVYDVTGIYIVSPTAWKKNGDDWGKQNPVGTGPFKLGSRQTDVNIKYVKNPNYWIKGKPYLDEIDFIIIKDPTTRLASFKAGNIDVSMDPSIAQVNEIKNDAKYFVHRGKSFGSAYRLNPDGQNADSPFSKLEVRQAVACAIDKQSLVDGIVGGYGSVTNQGFPAESWVYNPNNKGYPYDQAKAKQLLASAGYPNGIEISIIGNNTGIDPTVCTAIQAMLAKANIKVNLDLRAPPAVMQAWSGGWKSGLGFSSLPPNPNMVSWTAAFSWSSKRQTAVSLLNAPEIDEACTKATTCPSDLAVRQPIVWNLIDILYNKYVQSIPLFITDALMVQYPQIKDTGIHETCLTGSWTPETGWLNR